MLRAFRASTLSIAVMSARIPPPVVPPPGPKSGKVKIALCQLLVSEDKTRNILHAEEKIKFAVEQGAELIVLPEMWNCPYSNDSFPAYAEVVSLDSGLSPSCAMLSSVAKSCKVTLVGGSIPERREGKLYNTCLVYGSTGELKGKFSKLHLFDIDIPGEITFKESLTLTPGDGPLVIDTEVGRIGIGICYDLRFPELAMLYSARGAHMVIYPGAFNMTTGPLHWELLQRARAVDNQLFVVTCSPARNEAASYHAWGHSSLIGPFAEVLSTTSHEEDVVFGEIDFDQIQKRRLNLPLGSQRRGDVYELVDVQRRE